MNTEDIKQFIVDKIPHTLEKSGITNKYYMIMVINQMLSLELSMLGNGTTDRYRLVRHADDHHINNLLIDCTKNDFIDCLLLLDFLING